MGESVLNFKCYSFSLYHTYNWYGFDTKLGILIVSTKLGIMVLCSVNMLYEVSASNSSYTSAGKYVLVITSRKEAGTFLGFPVFRVTSMKFLHCNEALKFSNYQEVRFCFFWSKKIWLYGYLLQRLIFFLFKFTCYVYYAEEGWGLLHESIESSGSNSRIVLFIRNRYNTEVNSFTLEHAL